MAKSNVTPIKKKTALTPEELEQELIESNHGVIEALDHMRRVQLLAADSKNVSDNALAKAEKWWRYEIENRDRVEKNLEGGKYTPRVRYTNIPQGQAALEEVTASMDKVENITSPDRLVELETEKDGE